MGWANYRATSAGYDYNPSTDVSTNYIRAVRPCEYNDYMQLLQSVKNNGGNYIRVIVSSFSWALEWEKLWKFL